MPPTRRARRAPVAVGLALTLGVSAIAVVGSGLAQAVPRPPKPGTPCSTARPNPPGFACVKGTWRTAKPARPGQRPSARPSARATTSPTPNASTPVVGSAASAPGWTTGPSNTLFSSGTLTIGTSVSLAGPQVGSVYACQLLGGDGQAGGNRQPWIHGTTWSPAEKLKVQGDRAWGGSASASVAGGQRILSGNGLPVTSHTGTFPIAASDPARRYDGNPNAIAANAYQVSVPAVPQVAAAPSCMRGGAIGYTTNGVAIFNALDAANRDAAVYEVLDQCWGHPERNGKYHVHTMSTCADAGSATANSPVWGFMLDGFPITGPWEGGVRLTTADLDVCHGRVSEITLDGARVTMYHYVATEEFPYTAGCYRGTPVAAR